MSYKYYIVSIIACVYNYICILAIRSTDLLSGGMESAHCGDIIFTHMCPDGVRIIFAYILTRVVCAQARG